MTILQKMDRCMLASLVRPRLLIGTTNSALAIIALAVMAIRGAVWMCLPVPTTPGRKQYNRSRSCEVGCMSSCSPSWDKSTIAGRTGAWPAWLWHVGASTQSA
jgi:hypothetical protein